MKFAVEIVIFAKWTGFKIFCKERYAATSIELKNTHNQKDFGFLIVYLWAG